MTLVERIVARQEELGVTDSELCTALGYERDIVLTLIKSGSIKFPIPKIPALATALSLDDRELLRAALIESSPDLLATLDQIYNPIKLSAAEVNLIRHLRNLAGDRAAAPIVFEGKAIIALVTA